MSRMMAVLHAVVEEYVDSGVPVGSRTIVDNHDLGVSAATVRADLSRLEGTGHLIQPHVSAGRVPTDLGYRATVDDDLAAGGVAPASLFSLHADSVGEAMRQIASAMANMTHCLAIVSDPVSQGAEISRIALVRTKGSACVLVVVCDDGRVDNRVVSCAGLSDRELAQAESILCRLFVGKDVLAADTESCRLDSLVDSFVARLAASIRASALRRSDAAKASAGVSLLLAQPEFRDPESVRLFVGAYEDEGIDFDSLLSYQDDGLVVRIGREIGDDRLSSLSFVAKEYEVPSGRGFVACVGPTRMDYRSTIGVVEAGAAEAAGVISGAIGI